jgi:hypothetical protein
LTVCFGYDPVNKKVNSEQENGSHNSTQTLDQHEYITWIKHLERINHFDGHFTLVLAALLGPPIEELADVFQIY